MSAEEQPVVATTAQADTDLRTMFAQFLQSANDDRMRTSKELSDLRTSIASLAKGSPQMSVDSPIPDRSNTNRRSSMFFGSPEPKFTDIGQKSTIQVLHADIVYDKELKVSSLEGLQYLAKQLQLMISKYPGREIRTAHMVAFSLRPHVVASWNSYCYKQSLITGIETNEIMVEDWLALSNVQVHEILVESARPRTRELYSRELVLFLGKGIPQSPLVNTENFSQLFYAPFMKSLNDLLHLHDLLSLETTNYSNNAAKMPVPGYGTRDVPGQVALWILSLGTQKDSILQWLGKDELMKHKTLEPAVKYIRSRLMEGRLQSEARQDFDSKLTPIRYEDIRHTQGETHTRQQINFHSKPHNKFPHQPTNARDHRSHISLVALDTEYMPRLPCTDNDDDGDYQDFSSPTDQDDIFEEELHNLMSDNIQHDSLMAIQDNPTTRSAVACAFRGYCSDLFVFGKCSRRDTNCPLDHSAAGQEKCIQSFLLLAKRELGQHGQLPAYVTTPKPERTSSFSKPSFLSTRPDSRIPRLTSYPPRQPSMK
jgi:hypothetical protein